MANTPANPLPITLLIISIRLDGGHSFALDDYAVRRIVLIAPATAIAPGERRKNHLRRTPPPWRPYAAFGRFKRFVRKRLPA
jgi:hypothetical protein